MHTEATSSQLNQTLVFKTFTTFINQRPGLDFADYGQNAQAFRAESAAIGRDKKRVRPRVLVILYHDYSQPLMLVFDLPHL